MHDEVIYLVFQIWNEIIECSDVFEEERLQSSFQSFVEEELKSFDVKFICPYIIANRSETLCRRTVFRL